MSDAEVHVAPYWCTIQCQPHRERVAEHFLRLFGFEVYLPRVRHHQFRWRRRIERLMPLFPGYCFTRIELQWHVARQCPGVIRIVRGGSDEPARVPDRVITAIRSRERNGALDLPKRGPRAPRVGDRVRVALGPFVGHTGVVASMSRGQVTVLLFMLGTQRQVRLRRDMVDMAQ
jgi:transcriptional antiterminator RfaH